MDSSCIIENSWGDLQLHGREIFLREDREDFELKGSTGRGGARGAPPSRSRGQDVAVVGRQLYVSNLSTDTTWQTLKDYFKFCGPVLHADIFTVGPDALVQATFLRPITHHTFNDMKHNSEPRITRSAKAWVSVTEQHCFEASSMMG